MHNQPAQEEKLKQNIAALEARLADLKARLPAHSIPPAMIAALDDLDDALAQANAELAALHETK